MAFSTLAYILMFTILGSFIGLVGGILLLYWHRLAVQRIFIYLVNFAIGVLLGATFLDLLPEAIELSSAESALVFTFCGLLAFFLLEKFITWHYCHELVCRSEKHTHVHPRPFSYLLLVGDTVHNFIDGIIIAVAFLMDIPLGIIASLAVFFHEIPQEIADFGMMLYAKMKKPKILFYNVLSAVAALVGAVGTYFFAPHIHGLVPAAAAFAAGGFIYIALADLAPETHPDNIRIRAIEISLQTLFVFIGVCVIFALGKLLGA
ncbi:MAG: ZIP family metal transporter [Candidatus Aenigmatarchaeota archaeon]